MYIHNSLQKKITISVFLLPTMLGVIVFSLIPLISSVFLSFFEYNVLKPFTDARFIGLQNYQNLFTHKELFSVLQHTLYYMILYIPGILITSILLANLFIQYYKGTVFFKFLSYIPVITSWVAVAVIWRWVLNDKYGFLNNFLLILGIDAPNWITDPTWAMPGVVVASIWKDTGYFALIFLAALKSINKVYYEAANIDGANWFKKFTYITLPLISPTILLVLIMNIISGFQVFDSVYVMTNGGPGDATTVMVERIYRHAFRYFKMGFSSSYALVLFVIIFIFTLIQLKLQKRWVNYDA